MLRHIITSCCLGFALGLSNACADSLTLFSLGDQEPYGLPVWQFVEDVRIHGNTVAGQVRTASFQRPFMFDLSTGTGSVFGSSDTFVRGVHAGTVVGYVPQEYSPGSFRREGFIFDGTNLVTVAHPQTGTYPILDTVLLDYDGSRYLGVVGAGYGFSKLFWFDGTNFEYLDLPAPHANGVEGFPDVVPGVTYGVGLDDIFHFDGNRVVGSYYDFISGQLVSFLLEGDQLTPFLGPNGETAFHLDIDGNAIVGNLLSASGDVIPFLYNNGQWTYLNDIDPNIQTATGIDGQRIVGSYLGLDINGTLGFHGYVLELDALKSNEVPEPASAALWTLLAATAGFFVRPRKNKRSDDDTGLKTNRGFAMTFVILAISLIPGLSRADSITLFDLGPGDDLLPFYRWVEPSGISGDTIIGVAYSTYSDRGFVRQGASTTYLNLPFNDLLPLGVSGNTVVGTTESRDPNAPPYHNFVYSGGNLTSISHPNSPELTLIFDYDGSRFLGVETSTFQFFTYDGINFEYLNNFPPIDDSALVAALYSGGFRLDGDRVLGYFYNPTLRVFQSFIYDGTSYSLLYGPNGENIRVTDFSGESIVGFIQNSLFNDVPFLFHAGQFLLLPDIDTNILTVTGIDGDRLVGAYYAEKRIRPDDLFFYTGTYGYVLQLDALATSEVPEPASAAVWSLLAIGAFAYQRVQRRVFHVSQSLP